MQLSFPGAKVRGINSSIAASFCFCFCLYPLQTPVKDIMQRSSITVTGTVTGVFTLKHIKNCNSFYQL